MKKTLSTTLLWALYIIFGIMVGYIVHVFLERPVSMSFVIGVGAFLLLAAGNEALDRKLTPKKEVPSPENFVETTSARGDRAIMREYILAGGEAETMREYLRSRS